MMSNTKLARRLLAPSASWKASHDPAKVTKNGPHSNSPADPSQRPKLLERLRELMKRFR